MLFVRLSACRILISHFANSLKKTEADLQRIWIKSQGGSFDEHHFLKIKMASTLFYVFEAIHSMD